MMKQKPLPKHFYFVLIPLILWTALILAFSVSTGEQSTEQSNFISELIIKALDLVHITLPPHAVSELHVWVRKLIGHFGMFAIEGALTYMTLYFGIHKKHLVLFLLALAFGGFIAGLSELAQLFTPERAGLLLDVVIDLIGFIFAALMTWSLLSLCGEKKKARQRRA